MPLVLEGILTTLNADGSVNISPMGPIVDPSMATLTLRPYNTSTTYANLKRTGEGVFHVTDDVELLARAAVGSIEPPPKMIPSSSVEGRILADACRWYALQVGHIDESHERVVMTANVVARGRLRDLFGLNRAKHAVVEAAILTTRVRFLPPDEILAEFERLKIPVEKTGGPAEHAAYDFLLQYVQDALRSRQ